MQESKVVLEVNNISKKYIKKGTKEPFWALKDVSFNVNAGEILGIVGRNGAGKSTILKILSETIPPTDGNIKYKGTIVSILDIGTGFHPDLSGYDNIFLCASLLGMTKKQMKDQLDAIIEFSGVASSIHEPVRNYSNGMYLRLAFSVAIHVNAQILLLDEVIAVGDAEFKVKCYSKIRELGQSGITILLVTHNLSQVLEFCSRCIWIDQGEIMLDDKPIEVAEKYRQVINEAAQVLVNMDDSVVLNIDNFVSLTNIQLCYGENVRSAEFWPTDSIKITMDCDKLTNEGSLEVAYYITNMDDVRVFLDSYCLRNEHDSSNYVRQGLYRLECLIPGNLLTRGIYSLSIIICKSSKLVKDLGVVKTFKIKQFDDNSGDQKFLNEMNLIIKPLLEWKVEYIKRKE